MATMLLLFCGCSYRKEPTDWHRVRGENSDRDVMELYSSATIPPFPMTLDDIVSVALQKNLSLLVVEQELAIQRERVTRERFRMLPNIFTCWESYGRTENRAIFSESLVPGVPPAPLSLFSEQNIMRWNSGIVWNLVDFGAAFFKTQQEKSKVMMAHLEMERLKQNLVVELTRSYWRAVVAKQAIERSSALITKTMEQQSILQERVEGRDVSELQGLRNENQLLNIRGKLQSFFSEYHSAKTELAQLMGLPSSVDFELAEIDECGVDIDLCEVEQLESWALVNRPELFSLDIEELVHVDEAKEAICRMMPGVELFAGALHDSNKFLLHNNWLIAGARAAWDLLNMPSYYSEKKIACKKRELVRRGRLAVAAGVIAQVHLSYLLYQDHLESYIIAKELESVNKRMFSAARAEQNRGKLHAADLLKYEAEALFAEIDASIKYGKLQDVIEQLNSAIGMPRFFRTTIEYRPPLYSCEEISFQLEENRGVDESFTPFDRASEEECSSPWAFPDAKVPYFPHKSVVN